MMRLTAWTFTAHSKRQCQKYNKPDVNCSLLHHLFIICISKLIFKVKFFNINVCFFQENGFSFSLEAVRRLQELTAGSFGTAQQNPRFRSSAVPLCADPMLPQELLPLCKQRGASSSLSRLAAVPMDICEICAFAACTGC
uniref:Guanylate cyclase activator 2B n=1 Tax=Acanthochromis polyacanthus TaxID=80966 RepID=A0A3Q1EZ72_9TELE